MLQVRAPTQGDWEQINWLASNEVQEADHSEFESAWTKSRREFDGEKYESVVLRNNQVVGFCSLEKDESHQGFRAFIVLDWSAEDPTLQDAVFDQLESPAPPITAVLYFYGVAMRRRACGAVIHEDQILMVRHVHHGRDYWTLPGGGINWRESPAQAAEREVLEETGLSVSAKRCLFTSKNNRGKETYCYLMSTPDDPSMISLGVDPEQAYLPPAKRMLQDVQWHSIESMDADPHVSQVLAVLNMDNET